MYLCHIEINFKIVYLKSFKYTNKIKLVNGDNLWYLALAKGNKPQDVTMISQFRLEKKNQFKF